MGGGEGGRSGRGGQGAGGTKGEWEGVSACERERHDDGGERSEGRG